jgi:hypothetical protein
MNIKRKLTSPTAAVALAAATLVPIATSANAEPWNGGHRDGGYAHNDRGAVTTAAAAMAAGTTSTPTAGTSITTPASTSRSASAL